MSASGPSAPLVLFSVPMDCFTSRNSVETDEIPHYVAFHLGLHCLSKLKFTEG